MTSAEEQELNLKFTKDRYSLLHVLSKNVGSHEKQIIADHDPVVLVPKLTQKYSDSWDANLEFWPSTKAWTSTDWMTTWLPFGYLCLHAIARKYDDTGVSDALSKFNIYVASKKFTPSDPTGWVSMIEHAWNEWKNTVTDPDHLAALELIREILASDDDDWKAHLTMMTGKLGFHFLPITGR
jgi:hypothetical protein